MTNVKSRIQLGSATSSTALLLSTNAEPEPLRSDPSTKLDGTLGIVKRLDSTAEPLAVAGGCEAQLGKETDVSPAS